MEKESVKKSFEKSKNGLEEKPKIGQAKFLQKKDLHVYNNYLKLRSRAINNSNNKGSLRVSTREQLQRAKINYSLIFYDNK